ncbi:unnamed protein product, partial [Musa hybrid cultivar]
LVTGDFHLYPDNNFFFFKRMRHRDSLKKNSVFFSLFIRGLTEPSTLPPEKRMEGLIPYIYRAIKRRKARKYYRSLSTVSSQWFGDTNTQRFLRPPPIKLGGFHQEQNRHRRHRSLEDFSSKRVGGGRGRLAKQTRFGWFSRMFSCITGAN